MVRSARLTIADLGHEEPTLLLTNQLSRSAGAADRPLRPADADREQHRGWGRLLPHGRPVSAVAMKVNCDLQLTLMASSLYRLLAAASAMVTRPPSRGSCS